MEHWQKNITLFLSSQAISHLGSSLVQYAIMWHITLTTKSGVMMTLFIICGFLPTFFLSPFAGVWADRYNRKMLIMISDALIAVSTLVLAILFLLGYYSVWLLFVIAGIRALGAGVQTPAVGAVLPQIVPEDKLTRINGINGSIQALVMFVSPLVSAALLAVTTLENIFFIDVITAAIAIFTLFFFLKIPLHEKASAESTGDYFADFKKGLLYIKEHAFLKQFFLFIAIFMVLMAPAAFLTPLQVTRSFGDDVWRLSAIEIAFSVGMMGGGALIASWGGFRNKVHTITFASMMMGGCTLALGIVPIFALYLLVMALFGLALPIFNTPSTVMIQEKVETNYLGRIFGVFSMITTSMMPIGMLIFGPIADMIKIEWLLLGTGLLILVLASVFIRNKPLLAAGMPAMKEAGEAS